MEPKGIGYSKLWMLPDTHPFYPAACWHDQQYDLRKAGELLQKTSLEADIGFYNRCKQACGNSRKLKAEALAFYFIVRAWGRFRWPR
jgi:hypothetical protein